MAVAASAIAQDATTSAATTPVSSYAYDIPLFREETAFTNPTNTWTYFFEVRPGVRLMPGAFVELYYNSSTTLIKGQGSLTVLVNNVPVSSRKLADGTTGPWKVEIPLERLKQGFNELRIVSRQRSLDGPCQDLDNLANWVRFGKQSRLHLVREDRPTFPLASYPFPYLDNLETNPVRATWMLPAQATDKQISELLEMASDWGRKETIRPLPIRVATTSGGPAVLLGNSPTWQQPESATLGENEGLLKNFSRTGRPGASQLVVAGNGDGGVARARETLTHPEMVEQISGTWARIVQDPAQDPARPTTKIGTFTLTDLGYPQITLSGAFHQRATITIQRPIRADLGKESYIKFRFRHSASLNPLRSILSIFLNGTPIASARLDPGNANDGTITARIPVEELAKSKWVLELAAYHDLAAVDCSKTYDDVAWTVIQGESAIELVNGSLAGRPYLDSFPFLVGKNGLPPEKAVMSLSQGASETQLSVAAVLAARAAQVNRTPLNWEARTAALPDGDRSSITIGYFNEASRFSTIANDLLVAPTDGGKFKVDPKIRLLGNVQDGGAILQAIRAPGSKDAVMYVLLAADDNALRQFAQVLNNPEKSIQMTGEVVVVTRDGRVVSLSSVGTQQQREDEAREQQRYTPNMKLLGGAIIGAVLAGIFGLFSTLRKKPGTGA
ncbi:MAG: cellulose biosynthesis cyclic di-GMP-binding regulatory protein BcsB [Fimbriimonas sp.]